jgi:hypothetical protein
VTPIFFSDSRQVGRNLIIPGGTRIIDARGKFVIPGNPQILIGFPSACEDFICCPSTGENGSISVTASSELALARILCLFHS